MTAPSAHVILSGLDRLGLRTMEELRRLDEQVVVITREPDAAFARAAVALGATLIEGNQRDASVWQAAGVATARAAVLVEDDDLGNLHAALAAQDLNPALRLVLRMFNLEFGQKVEGLFQDCTVLSASAIAAPAFVAAALHQEMQPRLTLAGRALAVQNCPASGPGVLLPLAVIDSSGATTLFPLEGDDVACLVDSGPARRTVPAAAAAAGAALVSSRRTAAHGEQIAAALALFGGLDRRLRYLISLLLAVALVSTVVFYLFAGLDPVDALYFTVTIITTTGFGDINLRDASAALKLYAILLMLLGAAALTLFYAVVADAIVGARLARALGGAHRRQRDHVVVCGLGNIGFRIVGELARLGVPVVAVEVKEDARFLPAVRQLGVPVVVADARLVETIQTVNVSEARCLIAATSDDLANLETALNARALKPDLRVVLRLFDPDLAERVERTFGVHISRSVAALAGPAFAAAAVGREVLTLLPVGQRSLLVARVTVEAGSLLDGATVQRFESDSEGRLLLLSDGDQLTWRPAAQTALRAGLRLTVVATRSGLAEIQHRAVGRAEASA